ncbi:MAG: ATP-binding cassette domain-containing protein [Bacteroidetes bacterium]|nr:ATP-binding cassette domain-containing protein [Bacteroidota bacterium]
MQALTTKGITKRYGTHTALEGVDITVPTQSIYGLLGPNGAGKTTLIRIINQIINADEGDIMVFGEKLTPRHVEVIGYLPEERGLYKRLKVGEQLLYLAQLKGLSRSEALNRIRTWLDRFQIRDWAQKKVEDLSKGMAQKVQFISTVLHEPRLIILDEPFSGFDPVNAELITQEILRLKENGSTIIFSTHRMETVESLCDQIALINKSKKILEGSKKEVKQQFKTNSYRVEHRGAFQLQTGNYHVVKQKPLEEDHFESTIKMEDNSSPNLLLQELINRTEVFRFEQHLPTMSEIFIRLVKAEGDEALLKHLQES